MQNSIGTINITTAEFVSENPDGSINKRISQRSALATLISPRHVITVAHIFPPVLPTEKHMPVATKAGAYNNKNQVLTGHFTFNDKKHPIKKYIPIILASESSSLKSKEDVIIVELKSDIKDAPCVQIYSAQSKEIYEPATKRAAWHGVRTFTHTVFPELKEQKNGVLQDIKTLLIMPYHSVYGGEKIDQFILPLAGPDKNMQNIPDNKRFEHYKQQIKNATQKYKYSRRHYPLFDTQEIGAPIFWNQQMIGIITSVKPLPVNELGFSLSSHFWSHKTNAVSLIHFKTGKRRDDLNFILSKIGCQKLDDTNLLVSGENVYPFTKNVKEDLKINNTLVNKLKYMIKKDLREISTPVPSLKFTIFISDPIQFQPIERTLNKLYPNEENFREKVKKAFKNKDLYVVQKKDTIFMLVADQSHKMEFELFEEL